MAEHGEAPEAATEQALDQANPAAIALALGRTSKGGKSLDAKAEAFLEKQTRLLDLQTEHLHEQRELQTSRLRLGRWKDRISLALQGLTAVVGIALVAFVATMAWQAHEDHGLVIEAFSVPPDLVQRGLTGDVIASRLIDKVKQMQALTNSARAPQTYVNNWGDDIKVEIPETGVSIGQLSQYLRRWLGHQTRITGELVHTPSGLSLTARSGPDAGDTFEGPEGDLDKLFQQAAEAVYRHTQPYRYGSLLTTSGDIARARPIFEALAADGDQTERMWAELGLVNLFFYAGDLPGAERGYIEMDRRDPNFVMGVGNISSTAFSLDHEQAALDASRRALVLIPGDANPQVTPTAAKAMARGAAAGVSEALGDFQDGARREANLTELPDYDGSRANALVTRAMDLAFNHQPAAAAAVLAGAHAPAGVLPAYVSAFDAQVADAREIVDVSAERWSAAIADGVQAQTLAAPSNDPVIHFTIGRQAVPWMAYARAQAGDQAGAETLIAQTPLDADTALRLRGKIAAVKGDWASAEHWFVLATRQAPSIPFAFVDWSEMLLAKGDVNGAIAKLALAHSKGPHDADALELWGEALTRKGDFAGAAAKFADAAKDAPNWGRDHLLWGKALLLSGRYHEARAQFEMADGLDLNSPDRAALAVFLARTASGLLRG